MDDKKKKFIMPDAEIVDFNNEDIITASVQTEGGNDWNLYPDVEDF